MLPENTKVWLDWEITELKDAKVWILTHSLHYGTSVFEWMRAYKTTRGTKIFRNREHIERLFYSAETLFMDLPYTVDEVMDACYKVLEDNNLEEAYLRPIAFYDDSSMGLSPASCKPRLAIIAWEWGKYLAESVRVKISSIKRISDHSLIVDAKVWGHYVNSVYANAEAKKLGYDEALLLDEAGYIAEGPWANIFFIKDKTLVTPRPGKILPWITRNSIVEVADELGYDVIEREVTPYELNAFDSAFFCGTAAEVTPIKEISGVEFDVTKCEEIKDEFMKVLKWENEDFIHWIEE